MDNRQKTILWIGFILVGFNLVFNWATVKTITTNRTVVQGPMPANQLGNASLWSSLLQMLPWLSNLGVPSTIAAPGHKTPNTPAHPVHTV